MRALPVVAGYALQEALRRRIFHVVLVLTAVYLGLFWLGADTAFEEVTELEGTLPVEERELTGGTLFGLSMFGTLFLGAVLAAFLTLGVVRGDAERGLLQPLVVRPVGRGALLVGRFLGAAAVCIPYVLAVYTACALITRAAGDWWPDEFLRPGIQLAAGVLVIGALALLGSVFLSATANGIAVFMVFGAGLVAGLLGQIGEALNSETLQTVADRTSWALPFEALYQDALYRITSESRGLTGLAIQLGPFGGSEAGGANLPLWVLAYFAVVLGATIAAFARKDL
ncbi:MAG TPA: ABC transporter permease [Gaiellaceae bacterium]|nr:ABC transporter permease [Gaiellaceae bacterium]